MNSGEINPANIEEVLFRMMIELLILHTSRQLPLTSRNKFKILWPDCLSPCSCMQITVLSNWTSHDRSPSLSYQTGPLMTTVLHCPIKLDLS